MFAESLAGEEVKETAMAARDRRRTGRLKKTKKKRKRKGVQIGGR